MDWKKGGVMVGLLVAMLAVGCADPRISLEQFIQLQAQYDQAAEQPPPEDVIRQRQAVIADRLAPYRVGPDDELAVTPTAPPDAGLFPFQVRVDRDGRIDLPYAGQVHVGDMELQDVESAIKSAYVPAFVKDVAIHVSLLTPMTTNVLVAGAVATPGLVPLPRNQLDVLHAVALAGGINPSATGRVTLKRLRRPGEVVTLDLSSPDSIGMALAQDPLEEGDIVEVEGAPTSQIYVGGLVNAPRPVVLPANSKLTVLHVLAAAGGLRTDVFPKEATLIRRMPDGRDVQVKLNLDRLTTGKDPNIMLASGDILWVPDTLATRAQDWINRNVFLRVGGTATVNYNVSGREFLNRRNNLSGTNFNNTGGTTLMDQFDPFGFLLTPTVTP